MIFDIPYRSQLTRSSESAPADAADGDCGPTNVSMLLAGQQRYISPNEIGKVLQKPGNYTAISLREMQTAMRYYGLQVEARSRLSETVVPYNPAFPTIALVYYPLSYHRYSLTFQGGHYVLIVGTEGNEIVYHDPFYPDVQGAYLRAPWQEFRRAWGATGDHANVPGWGLVVRGNYPIRTEWVAQLALQAEANRWNLEEMQREYERGDAAAAERRRLLLIAALYGTENTLKQQRQYRWVRE